MTFHTTPQLLAFSKWFTSSDTSPWDKPWLENDGEDGDAEELWRKRQGRFKERFDDVFGDIDDLRMGFARCSMHEVLKSESAKMQIAVCEHLTKDMFGKIMGHALRTLQALTPMKEAVKPPLVPQNFGSMKNFGKGKMKVRFSCLT